MGRTKDLPVTRRCTHPSGCVQPRTPFKHSPFCAYHTCDDYQCARATEYGISFCHFHLCEHPACGSKKTYGGAAACYDHVCSQCRLAVATTARDANGRQLCDQCDKECRAPFCHQPRQPSLLLCLLHQCLVDGCTEATDGNSRGYGKSRGYCFRFHRCRLCWRRAIRHQLCEECIKFCCIKSTSCLVPRPPDHPHKNFFCSDHGCHECHASIFASGYLRRARWTSIFCHEHIRCGTPACPFPRISTNHPLCDSCQTDDKTHSSIPSVIWIAHCKRRNRAISRRDSQTHHLMCRDYCSAGYCKCDLMPRLDMETFQKALIHARGEGDEPVILVSSTARTTTGDATFAAWTMPLICLQYDDPERAIDLIRFEEIKH